MWKKIEKEKGELTIEAIIVVTVTIFIIFLTLDIALAVYRQVNVSVTANKVADNIGNIYGSPYKEPDMGYQNKKDFKKLNLYRFFGKKNTNQETVKKAMWYAGYSLKKTELSSQEADYANEIQASIDTNTIGNQVITVTITRKYEDFFLKPISWFGIEPYYTCTASGTAQCYDVIGYINEKSFRQEMYKKLDGTNQITTSINSIISAAKTLIETVELFFT